MGPEFGDWEAGERYLLRAMSVDSTSGTHHWNLSVAQVRLGKYDVAAATLDSWRRQQPEDPRPVSFSAMLAAAQRDWARAEDLALQVAEVRPGNTMDEANGYGLQGMLLANKGKLNEAGAVWDRSEGLRESSGGVLLLGDQLDGATLALDVLRDDAEAARIVDQAIEEHPPEDLGAFDVPLSLIHI